MDDDAALRAIIADIIAPHGFAAVAAESAEIGLRVATASSPDVAIVDQHLPGASGAQFVRWLRVSRDEHLWTLPIIGLSGGPWSGDDLMRAGACCFVAKPIKANRLVQAIRWALEVYRPQRETG